MKYLKLTLLLSFMSMTAFGQRYYNLTQQYDSVAVRKLKMMYVPDGVSTDSILVKKPNNGVFKVPSSMYVSASSLTSSLGLYTPTARILTINGVPQDLSVNRSWSIPTSSGTVTSFSATSGYGVMASVSTATSTPALAISVDSASVNGVVSKSRLNTALSALSGSSTPNARTLTINGVTQDLTANRSWTIASTMPELLKTANYTVLASDWGFSDVLNLMVDATAGNLIITLPTSGMYGKTIQIKKVDLTMNTVTINGAIDRATSLVLGMPDSNAQLYASQLLSKYVTQ